MIALGAITPNFFRFGTILDVDLSVEHVNEPFEVVATTFAVLFIDGTCTVRFDRITSAEISLSQIGSMSFGDEPVKRIYITNSAQTGKTAKILVTEIKDVTIQAQAPATLVRIRDSSNIEYDARLAKQDMEELYNARPTDANAHDSSILTVTGYRDFLFYVKNGTDKTVTLKYYGSLDGTNYEQLGEDSTLTTGTSEYQTLSEAWEYLKVNYQAEITPTSGTLLIELDRRS